VAIEADPQRRRRTAWRPERASFGVAITERHARPSLRRAVTTATVILLVAGGLLRVGAAVTQQGVIYPDETYQMTEAAHRAVFGYGIVPWEFQDGLRSWIGPGFLLPPTALARLLDLDGLHGMIVVKVWVALWATAGVAAGAVSARRLAGPLAGLLAASILAFSPLAAVYDAHPLADTVAAPLPVLALLLLTLRAPLTPGRSPRRTAGAAALAGALLVAALALRPQLAPVVLGFVVATVLTRSRIRILALAAGLVSGAALSGLLDVLTWGVPFAPEWRSMTFNLVQDGGSRWGRQPVSFYLHWSSAVLGPVLLVLLAGGLVLAAGTDGGAARGSVRRLPVWPLVAGVAALACALSVIAHKELRFLIAALPLAGTLSAVGLTRAALAGSRWLPRLPGSATVGLLTAVAAVAGVLQMPAITMSDLGYTTRDLDAGRLAASAWVADDATPRLLSAAGRLRTTCGVVVLAQRLTWTGGYSYLHRDVPLASTAQNKAAGNWRAWANVVVTSGQEPLPQGYAVVARSGPEVLAERGGSCAAAPAAVQARVIPPAKPSPPGGG
jgi:GPI mannosyltransferase 3